MTECLNSEQSTEVTAVPFDKGQTMAMVECKLEDLVSISFLVTVTKYFTETREERFTWVQSSIKFIPRLLGTMEEATCGAEVLIQEVEMEKGILDPYSLQRQPLETYMLQLASIPKHSKQEPGADFSH